MQSVGVRILKRIQHKGRGWVFCAKPFFDLGSRSAVDQALSRLARTGKIRRLSWGVYDYPQLHKTIGPLTPSVDAIAKAISTSSKHKLQVSPARAANMFGLSTQVPAKSIYLTDGTSRQVKAGNQMIIFKHAGRQMLGAGSLAGTALQALRYFGEGNVSDDVIGSLRGKLPDDDKNSLSKLRDDAPTWTHSLIDRIAAA